MTTNFLANLSETLRDPGRGSLAWQKAIADHLASTPQSAHEEPINIRPKNLLRCMGETTSERKASAVQQ